MAAGLAGAHANALQATVISLQVIGPTQPISPGQLSSFTVLANGSTQRLVVQVRSQTPEVVSLPRGASELWFTTGGSTNAATVKMRGAKPGNYQLSARLVAPAGINIETARQELLGARQTANPAWQKAPGRRNQRDGQNEEHAETIRTATSRRPTRRTLPPANRTPAALPPRRSNGTDDSPGLAIARHKRQRQLGVPDSVPPFREGAAQFQRSGALQGSSLRFEFCLLVLSSGFAGARSLARFARGSAAPGPKPRAQKPQAQPLKSSLSTQSPAPTHPAKSARCPTSCWRRHNSVMHSRMHAQLVVHLAEIIELLLHSSGEAR